MCKFNKGLATLFLSVSKKRQMFTYLYLETGHCRWAQIRFIAGVQLYENTLVSLHTLYSSGHLSVSREAPRPVPF